MQSARLPDGRGAAQDPDTMDYIKLTVPVTDEPQADLLTALLTDYPFTGFETGTDTLAAYIPAGQLAACRAAVDALLARQQVEGRYESVAPQNWNAQWESGFTPVEIEGRLLIRAPFHAPAPAGTPEVLVLPRMAFGSGHHATTWLMARALLDLPLSGRSGLDMGSGTGVLSLVAVRCGAAHMDAVDIDEHADANCRDNIALNGFGDRITPIRGDAGSIAGRRYDFIVANIHRNILIADMAAYRAALRPGGDLLLSGFLPADVPAVRAAAEREGLAFAAEAEKEGWVMLRMKLKLPAV